MRDTLSPLCLAMYGDDARWGLPEQMLAAQADSLSWIVWSKTADAQKGRNKPKPIPRPGVTSDDQDVKHFGSDPVPLSELDELFGWAA